MPAQCGHCVPANFPLRYVKVDGRKTLGAPETRWKRWALQIHVILNNEDGNLLDALQLWKDNVDKEFEGLEPCPRVLFGALRQKARAPHARVHDVQAPVPLELPVQAVQLERKEPVRAVAAAL